MAAQSGHAWGADAGAALPVAIEVLRRGPISRAEIGRRLGLSHASLSRLSAPLLERGVIFDVGERTSGKVGRPSRLLDVDASSHHFLGIKIREHEIICAATDLRGDVLEHTTVPLSGREPRDVVTRIKELHAQFASRRPITGIGIGIGGAVHDRRVVTSAAFLKWTDVPLADLIEDATRTPALIENDVVALCEYEDWFGLASHDDRFAVVTIGIGTGYGLVVDGQPIVGDDYGIGLVGHWPMDPAGPLCAQGHRGCAAALLNSDAIARYATEALGTPTSFDETVQLAAEEHPAAARIVHDAAAGLGILLAAICNLTLPQRIIIGGEGVRLAIVGEASMLTSLVTMRDPRANTPPIDYATGDNMEWARGAAVLAIQAFALGRLGPPN
ncbi:ROK family protein [Microbacterium sp. YJN-G]|uniref:ROK family protein n=1 Tax=Microbacterium sp. YJN-G TaxID=2763257 RepID=UPI001877C476|nr:ROK family protein [Microbacterium sp. YJN-G]